jgi:hypothetical protein
VAVQLKVGKEKVLWCPCAERSALHIQGRALHLNHTPFNALIGFTLSLSIELKAHYLLLITFHGNLLEGCLKSKSNLPIESLDSLRTFNHFT